MTSNRDLARALNNRSLGLDRGETPSMEASTPARMPEEDGLWVALALGTVIGWGLGMVSAVLFGILPL